MQEVTKARIPLDEQGRSMRLTTLTKLVYQVVDDAQALDMTYTGVLPSVAHRRLRVSLVALDKYKASLRRYAESV